MADPLRGIHGSTPVETMHSFRKGMIEMVKFLVLENVPPSKLAALDALAIRFHRTHRQTIRSTFPATNFSQGITNLTKISASERLGLVFLFVILAQYDEGWQILQSTFDAQHSKAVLTNDDAAVTLPKPSVDLPAVLAVFEALLCFDQWLNQATYWTKQHHAESILVVQKAIQTLLHMCVDDIPLANGKSWKFSKFHELLHLLDNMEWFGAPINYCAQRPKSLLIPVAKKLGRRTQKRHNGSAYELQSAQRLLYLLMINAVYTRIWDTSANHVRSNLSHEKTPCIDIVPETSPGNATFATLTCDFKTGYQLCWYTQTKVSLMHIPDNVLQFVSHQFGSHVRMCSTELRHRSFTYRCHPSFQSGGSVYDWMNVRSTNKKNKVVSILPCRLAIVVITKNPQPFRLVVQFGKAPTGIKSVLLTEWEMSKDLSVIEPKDIEGPCFVISIKDDGSKILQALPRHLWALKFTEPVESTI